jgi:hypothetical protein
MWEKIFVSTRQALPKSRELALEGMLDHTDKKIWKSAHAAWVRTVGTIPIKIRHDD